MTDTVPCHSCTMPIESGHYCQYCADDRGKLIAFEECFARMIQWTLRHEPELSREEAESKTFAFMSERPAWKDHPQVVAGVKEGR